MKHEFLYFLEIFNNKDYEADYKLLNHSLNVMKVITKARENINMVFPDDANL